MIRKERTTLKTHLVDVNDGRLDWLPKNPRQWTQGDIDKTARSIEEDTDFLEDRPLLVVEDGAGRFVAFCGNLRLTAAQQLKMSQVPAVVYHYDGSDEDRDTIMRRAMKDNGSFGQTDWDEVFSSEWGNLPLSDYGVTPPSWRGDLGLSTKDGEKDQDYQDFEDKFKPKLTTDDCYTPPAVYEAVLSFVAKITDLTGKKIERPFVPGGDFENYPYTAKSVVVDNPPFSLLSKICRFYAERGIPFFIFAPQLTLFTAADCDLTYIISDSDIEYENGARVRTGFITNLIPDLRIWLCPELRDAIIAAQPDEDKTKTGFVYPDNIVTAATLGKICKRSIELKIRKTACEYIRESDSAVAQGRNLYGGGFILSERAAAERAAATKLNLSQREREIIAKLDAQDK